MRSQWMENAQLRLLAVLEVYKVVLKSYSISMYVIKIQKISAGSLISRIGGVEWKGNQIRKEHTMAKFCITAHRDIINFHAKAVHSIEGLRFFDAYREDIIVASANADLATLAEEYIDAHPELAGWNFQIRKLD